MKLSEHFNLSEFTRSSVAEIHHLDNSIDPTTPKGQSVINNLQHICTTILEPLRNFLGEPIIISSGYRCPEVNALLGGVPNSQHLTGEAVDIVIKQKNIVGKSMPDLKYAYIWLLDNTRFDQLILESKGSTKWIHISLCLNDSKNRQHAFSIRK